MDQRQVTLLVEQFLYECGLTETFACLQRESGVAFESGQPGYPEKGGQLMEKLTAHYELECFAAADASTSSSASSALARQLTLPPSAADIPIGVAVVAEAPPSSSSSSSGASGVPHSTGKLVTGLHRGGVTAAKFSPDGKIVASGGTDRCVVLSTPVDGRVLHTFAAAHDGAVLGLAWNPRPERRHWLLSAAMDGKVKLLDCRRAVDDGDQLAPLGGDVSEQLHSKYVVRVRWHPDGEHFATASYDQTAWLCRVAVDESTGAPVVHRVQQYFFTSNVETVEFSPDGAQLLIAPRSDNYLTVVQVDEPTSVTRRNLNANQDDHVSFSVLDLAFSADGQALLVQTDVQRIILLHYHSFAHLRNFYGAQNDQFSQPNTGWDPSGKYIFGSSLDHSIYVWEIASQQVVHRLCGHTKKLRCFDIHHQSKTIVSGGFDQALCYYTS